MKPIQTLHELAQSLWRDTFTCELPNDTSYVEALAARFTINTMPEATLNAFADHGVVGATLAADGGDSAAVLDGVARAGIDVAALARRLQDEGAASFVGSWNDLMACIDAKRAAIRKAG